MSAPDWATQLTRQVCKDYKRKLPKVVWWQMKRQHKSSGRAGHGRVHISAGSDATDQRLVLLHELAHHLVQKSRKGRRESHSMRFWRLTFELYERYGVDLDYAHERERHYRQGASTAYAQRTRK